MQFDLGENLDQSNVTYLRNYPNINKAHRH
jgi:hypothetical protein